MLFSKLPDADQPFRANAAFDAFIFQITGTDLPRRIEHNLSAASTPIFDEPTDRVVCDTELAAASDIVSHFAIFLG